MGFCASKDAVQESSINRIYPLDSSIALTLNYAKIPNKFKRKPQIQKFGLIGLQNLGNTCYINAAIQCLSNTQPLSEYFLQNIHQDELNIENPISSRGQITGAYAQLIQSIWNEQKKNYIDPIQLISIIQLWNPLFMFNTQQDSHELLAFLLDMLHEDLNRVKKKPYIEEKTFSTQPSIEQAQQAWSDYLKRNRSIIVDLFQGQSRNVLQCLICDTQSYKYETFMYLSLPIQQHNNLTNCLIQYLEDEQLEEDNNWFCPKCKSVQKSKKGIKLQKLPNILVIHLKRFKFTHVNRCKLRQLIDFPIYNLELNKYSECEQTTFDLYGVINHSGTLHSGHYTAYCKNKDTQKWYLFDDTKVKEVKEKEIISSEAYVLFYYKNCVDAFDRQSELVRSSIQRSQLSINKQPITIQQKPQQQQQQQQLPTIEISGKQRPSIEISTRYRTLGGGRYSDFDQSQTPQIFGKKKSYNKIKLTPVAKRKQVFFSDDLKI